MKLKEIKKIEGKITLMTGTRIGGDSGEIEIGGNDNPIVRNPRNGEPYIPGSSIKGKMRSLFEWLSGDIEKSGDIHQCDKDDCSTCRIFGRGAAKSANVGPTRLVVRDAYLGDESKKELIKMKERKGTDTEMKYENTINRITSKAMPRNVERIPAGISFDFEMTYKIFDIDDNGMVDINNLEKVKKALKLVELDGIGGGVSRGNGQIKFDLKIDGEPLDLDKVEI